MAEKPNWQGASRSSFGAQPKSTTPSSPMYGFGTAGHNPAVYISHRHIKNLYGTQSPGPAMYTHPSVWTSDKLGKQTESTKKSPAAFGFGTSSRFSAGETPSAHPPWPPPSSKMLARLPRSGHILLGLQHDTLTSLATGAVAAQPGPGNYETQDAWQKDRMGGISSSLNASPPKTRIGTEPRFSRGKDPAMPGGVPGPGTYRV